MQCRSHGNLLLLQGINDVGASRFIIIKLSQGNQAIDLGKAQLGIMLQHNQGHILLSQLATQILYLIRIAHDLLATGHEALYLHPCLGDTLKNAVNLLFIDINIVLRTYNQLKAHPGQLLHILHRQT